MNICSDFITFNVKKTICIKYGDSVKLTEHVILDDNVILSQAGVRHLDNFFNRCLDHNVDSNHKCSHFIGYYNQMLSNFGHLNPESVVTLFKFMVHFYGNITVIDLENVLRNGTNVTHTRRWLLCPLIDQCKRRWLLCPLIDQCKRRWLLCPLIDQYHIRHKFILRDIKIWYQDKYPPDKYPPDKYRPDKYPPDKYPPDKYPPDIYPPLNKVIKYRKIKVHLFKKIYLYIYIHIIYILHTYYIHITYIL